MDFNPSQKPRKLWQHLLGSLCPQLSPADQDLLSYHPIVLDLTSGSGGLTFACAEAGYNSIAFEDDERQFDLSSHLLTKMITSAGLAQSKAFVDEENEEEEDDNEIRPEDVARNLADKFKELDPDLEEEGSE